MFQFGGLGALFGGLSPSKPPVATGLFRHIGRAGLRGGNEGNCPGPPVMKVICLKKYTPLKNFCDSEVIQEYISTIIFLCCVKYQGSQQQLISL